MSILPISNEEIFQKSREVYDYVVQIRRMIHQRPELGLQEFETSALICRELDKMGISYKKGISITGVMGIIKGEVPGNGRVIGLRADMDALPIQDAKNVPYASVNAGLMHACGHDCHVAMLLGAARVLNDLKKHFSGAIKLIFQPAEEGPGGAKTIIEEGVLENPKVDAMLGFHVSSGDKTGRVTIKKGPCNAAQDELYISIKGSGGHAAYPHLSIDAIVLAAQVINAFQSIVSRRLNPTLSAVLSIGKINGGYRLNIIADRVEMEGTLRFFDNQTKFNLRKWIEEVLESICLLGGDYEVSYKDGYPSTINDEKLCSDVLTYLDGFLREEDLAEVSYSSMGSEDFAYFGREVPSLLMKIGTGGMNREFSASHHSSTFDVDEKAFINGVASYIKICLEFMKDVG